MFRCFEAVREEAEWKRRRAAKKIASKVSSVEKRLRTAEFIAKTVQSMGLSVAAEEYHERDHRKTKWTDREILNKR